MSLVRHGRIGASTILAFAILVALQVLPTSSAFSQSYNDTKPISYSVDGATATGYFKVVTEAINAIVREAYPGSDLTYKPGSPAGGILNVATGKSDIMFNGASPEVAHGLEGKPPFKEPLTGKFSFIMRMHEELVVHNLMLKDWADRNGVRSFDDIVAKKPQMRLAVNTIANLQSTLSMYIAIFEAHGVNEADLAKSNVTLFRGNTAEGLSQLRDGKVDALINGAFLPTAEIADIARSRPLMWIDTSADKIKAAADRWQNKAGKVPAGIYPFVEKDTTSIFQWTTAVAGNHVSEETVYKFLKALTDNQERVRKIHPSLREFSGAHVVTNPTKLPYHPGAARFFREAGLMK